MLPNRSPLRTQSSPLRRRPSSARQLISIAEAFGFSFVFNGLAARQRADRNYLGGA